MDALNTPLVDSAIPVDAPKPKGTKRRIGKLTAAEIEGLPGVNPTVVKKVEPDISYSLYFTVPVSGGVGNQMEAGQVHEFALPLNMHAQAKGVGEVSAINFSNNQAEVVLKLSAQANPMTSHAIPVAHAFTQLKEYLDMAPLLHQAALGKVATWKAKVNGTTIVDGRY